MSIVNCDILRQKEEAIEMAALGFIPVWADDLTEGMRVAVPVGDFSNREWAFGVVRDLRRSNPNTYDERGNYVHDDNVISNFFVLTDDGIHHTEMYGRHMAIWVNIEQSEKTVLHLRGGQPIKPADPELERLLAMRQIERRTRRQVW
jgi:hypothetical protein